MDDSDFRRIMYAELKQAHDEFMQMEARSLAAEKTLAEHSKPCVWVLIDVGWYKSGCGSDYDSIIGNFCPGCGHLVESKSPDDSMAHNASPVA